jgi:hypothetical protein
VTACGIKNAKGEPCVLEEWHDSSDGWMWRKHRTVDGEDFTFMKERERARPQRGYLMK